MTIAIFASLTIFLSSCSAMPDMFKAVEDIATDTAVTVQVDKEAIQKDTDIDINVQIKNKDKTKE